MQPGALPLAHWYHAYALFLNIIKTSDAALAQKLHADDTVKPFTISTLSGRARRSGAQIKVTTDTALSLKLTFLESSVFSHFMDGALKWGDKPLEIAGIPFRVEEVKTVSDDETIAVFQSYNGILNNATASRRIDLKFLTPTVFRSGGRRNNIFPEPALVFGSYFNKWQALSPLKMPDNISGFFDKLSVTRYRLETVMWDFGSYQEVGYCGDCRFEIDSTVPGDIAMSLNALADFAPFCGTGAKTTMGMGQSRRIAYTVRKE
jgi:CRISPR-associated endoribonuclease Cas6